MSLKTELQFMLDTYCEDYRVRDVDACLAFFDEKCSFISQRGVLCGKVQVEKLHAAWIKENRVERKMQVQQIDALGSHVYAIWRFRDTIVDPETGQSEIQEGTALGVIRLDPDDGWLIVACSTNFDADQNHNPVMSLDQVTAA